MVPSHGGGGEKSLWNLLYKGTNTFVKDCTLMTLSPAPPPPSTITLGIRFQIPHFRGTETFSLWKDIGEKRFQFARIWFTN